MASAVLEVGVQYRVVTLILAAAVSGAAFGCDESGGAGSTDASRSVDAHVRTDAPWVADAARPDAMPADAVPPDAMPIAIAITPITDFSPPEGTARSRELVLFKSAAEFTNYFGVAPPSSVDFSTQWALLYTEGALPVHGHLARIDALSRTANDATLFIDTTHQSPTTGCELLEFRESAFALVVFDALTGTAAQLAEAHTETSFSCTAMGQASGAECSRTVQCGADLICAGIYTFGQGWCAPASFHGIRSENIEVAIADGATIQRQIDVKDLSTVPLDLIVLVELDHSDPSELLITLTNPDTTAVVVWDNETAPGGPLLIHRARRFPTDESANGLWTLTITDTAGGGVGTLKRWSLEIVSWPD